MRRSDFQPLVCWLAISVAVAGGLLTATPAGAEPQLSSHYQALAPGLDYAHIRMTNWTKAEPWSIHVARLDRSRKDLHLTSMLASNQVFGTAPVSAVARSVPESIGHPLAAINTGYCINKLDPYLGAPRGLVITEGRLISNPDKYSFWMNENGAMHFGNVEAKFTVTLPGGRPIPIALNRECGSSNVVLFTHMLGDSTRATNRFELVLEDARGKPLSWRAGRSYTLRVKALNAAGNTALSDTIAVLSFGGDMAHDAARLRTGDKIKIELKTAPDLSKAVTACQAIFPIVQNGAVLKEFDSSKYMLGKHPRTAIGFNSRHFFMVVVDGRKKDLSTGMFPNELGWLMKALGCTEAMNLDGGGSTTFWSDGETRNSVAGSRERDRSDVLVIVKRAASNFAAGGR
jgi:large repetitive protein